MSGDVAVRQTFLEYQAPNLFAAFIDQPEDAVKDKNFLLPFKNQLGCLMLNWIGRDIPEVSLRSSMNSDCVHNCEPANDPAQRFGAVNLSSTPP